MSRKKIEEAMQAAWDARHDGNAAEAVSILSKACRQNPRNATLCLHLAWSHSQQGNITGAESAYRQAIHLDPTEVEYRYQFGSFLRPDAKLSETHPVKKSPSLFESTSSIQG